MLRAEKLTCPSNRLQGFPKTPRSAKSAVKDFWEIVLFDRRVSHGLDRSQHVTSSARPQEVRCIRREPWQPSVTAL